MQHYIGDVQKKYKYILGEINYKYDTRDIFLDPTSGKLFNLSIQPKYSLGKAKHYYRLQISYNHYFQLLEGFFNPVLILKTKLFLVLA